MNSITLKKINDIEVKPFISKTSIDKDDDMFNEMFFNLALISKKNSGKTTILGNILKRYAKSTTNIWVFSSTITKDATYQKILKNLKGEITTFTTIVDEDKNDQLEEILDQLKDEEDTKRDNIFIFDDLGKVRTKSVDMLLKSNRHYRAKTIISCHFLSDITPASIKQLDYAILFKSFSPDRLETLYKGLDLSIDFNLFQDAYIIATEKPYDFLYISTRDEELRRNFNTKLSFTSL